MNQGLYMAASGLVAVEARQTALANNIANVATPGFRRQTPVKLGFYQTFSEVLRHPFHFDVRSAPGGGVKLVETYTDLGAGALVSTGNPLNLAIQGPGYFVVDTPEGERFTRAGDFVVDADGDLATRDGFKVQSIGGAAIAVGAGEFLVAEDGSIQVDGQPAGQLRLVEFTTPERLLREGDNLYSAADDVLQGATEAADAPVRSTRVSARQLEQSNVNVTVEMADMMLGLRAYEANQRVIQTIDSTFGRLIEQVGMPS